MVQIAPIAQSLPAYLAQRNYSAIFIVADTNTAKLCYPLVQPHLPPHALFVVAAGEEQKNLATCEAIWTEMTRHALDRHALCINLGGGVIGDMGGFCAATYKRGIDFIQIPTTLLAQVDASVGGKLGIDFKGYKNHIGVFTQPQAVLIDAAFLATLPERELRSGFAEIAKHCLIQDAAMFGEIEPLSLAEQPLEKLIAHSVEIKKKIVAADPQEKGLRKILNYGHTLGHAVETYYLETDSRLLHGEAIAVGMILENYIAWQRGLLTAEDFNRLTAFFARIYGLPTIQDEAVAAILANTLQDKKNLNGEVRCSLLSGVGHCQYDCQVTSDELQAAIHYYQKRLVAA